MYLSFSGFKLLDGCDFAYWNSYINNTPTEAPDDRLGSIYGSVVGLIFEDFYNQKLWKEQYPRAALADRVASAVDKVIRQETTSTKWRKAGVLLWKGEGEGENPKGMYVNKDELVADVRDAVDRGVQIIRHHRLLGPDAQAEVKLDYVVTGGHKLGGRADLILLRTSPHRDRCIIDGKGSKHRDKYVDRRQLFWYAMLYQYHHDRLPDRLGFLFWRCNPDESMDWVDFGQDDIDQLREDVLKAIGRVERLTAKQGPTRDYQAARKVFLPVAEDERAQADQIDNACRFCPFGTPEICPKGAEVKTAIEKKAARRKKG